MLCEYALIRGHIGENINLVVVSFVERLSSSQRLFYYWGTITDLVKRSILYCSPGWAHYQRFKFVISVMFYLIIAWMQLECLLRAYHSLSLTCFLCCVLFSPFSFLHSFFLPSKEEPPERVLTPEEKEKIVRKQRRQGVILNTSTVTVTEDQEKEGKENLVAEVVLRTKRLPVRSQTINYGPACSRRTGELRRQSLCMLRQGHTGEGGSRRFKAALKKDSINEVHPGWESIRKLTKVVG